MLFIALLLNSIPLGRPVIDHVDVIEINMFYDPEQVDENNDVAVRTQILFWEVGKDNELHIVDWRWWDNDKVATFNWDEKEGFDKVLGGN